MSPSVYGNSRLAVSAEDICHGRAPLHGFGSHDPPTFSRPDPPYAIHAVRRGFLRTPGTFPVDHFLADCDEMGKLQTLSVKIRNLVGSTVELVDDHRCRPVLEPLLALRGLERFDLQYQAESVPIAGHPGSIFYSFIIPLPGQTLALIEKIKEAATRPRIERGDSA